MPSQPGFQRIDETIERFRAKTFGENYVPWTRENSDDLLLFDDLFVCLNKTREKMEQ